MNITTWKVALLLYGSGTCALIYQMAWLREFRLIFGASTASSAAVLAIFMGGLGLGSLLLGHRADKKARPLMFYANLELIIAATAALTPFMLWAVRQAYIATGGSPVMGPWLATVVRLVLAALVLLVPTFLMGGTLPAAARSVEHDADLGRRNLAMLYGLNTLGAVTGSALATFLLIEYLGTHKTLWAACLVNVLIALVARTLSASSVQEGQGAGAEAAGAEAAAVPAAPVAATVDTPRPVLVADDADAYVPPAFVLFASAVVGFAFLLMELVWYRMLGPILGGSTFTFGLILVFALLGIGLGGAAYSVLRSNKPATLTGFALTCALEALFIAVPFAIGDDLALLSMLLRALGSVGFWGLVFGWSIITTIVVLPAAIVSGFQFPLLIALLGRGRQSVGRHVGLAYAYNTVGAIVGSLAGGFGLLPLLTALWTWRAVVIVLAGLAVLTLAIAARGALLVSSTAAHPAGRPAGGLWSRLAAPAVAALVALLLLLPSGPTAAWRHGGIGAGRSDRFQSSPNALRSFVHDQRRYSLREWEGVESSVSLNYGSGYAFYVNGKSDGHIRSDAGTQIMSGLIGAIVHPRPKTSMVIGLGTGCTAGWLGRIPAMERVDVVELEPAILDIARLCGPGNHDVMNNPKVKVTIGDAREALLTTPNRYDLIFSEPSNPYRAGIASMYTHEWYVANAKRLQPGGIFLQWLQGYEVDGQTVRTVYATVGSVFPHVETWRTQTGDLLLMASLDPIPFDVGMMRERIKEEPFRSALGKIWRVTDVEGVLGHHLANEKFARSVAEVERGRINTDDHNFVEFSFARSVGTNSPFGPGKLLQLAQARGEERPAVSNGEVDWESVEDQRLNSWVMEGADPPLEAPRGPEPQSMLHRRIRVAALAHTLRGNWAAAIEMWKRQPRPPTDLVERLFMATALNEMANTEADAHIEKIREYQPIEAEVLTAQLRWKQRRGMEAVEALERAAVAYRTDPWPHFDIMRRAQNMAIDIARADQTGKIALRLYDAMNVPYCMYLLEDLRKQALVKIASSADERTGGRLTVDALTKLEPDVPWDLEYLALRVLAYRNANHPLTMRAAEELDEFRAAESFPFDHELAPGPRPAATQPATGPATGPATAPATFPAPAPAAATAPATAPAAAPPSDTAAPPAPATPPPAEQGAAEQGAAQPPG